MGLMDKVKQQAEQALSKAQQGVAQGQSKLDEVQSKRQEDALLRDLGSAYYAAERQGGSPEEVAKAMSALDDHLAGRGATDAKDDAPKPPAAQGAPAGDFTLGDL